MAALSGSGSTRNPVGKTGVYPLLNKRVSRGFLLASLAFLLFMTLYLLGFFADYAGGGTSDDAALIVTFVVISVICVQQILVDELDYSVCKMHWYFILIFFCFAPLSQYMSGYYPWSYTISADSMLEANGVVICWSLCFCISSLVFRRHAMGRRYDSLAIPNTASMAFTVGALGFASVFYLVSESGIDVLVSSDVTYAEAHSWLQWIINYAAPGTSAICCTAAFLMAKSHGGYWWFIGVSLIPLVVLANNPLYCSRFWIAAAYIPIILSLCPRALFANRRFDVFVLIALLVIFPVMTVFKTMTIDQVDLQQAVFSYAGLYNSIDFDAYSMLVRTMDYVDRNGYAFGGRLFSTLLYMVPGMAEAAGEATGALVSGAQGATYTNLSAPLQAEAYFDFGVVGVAVGAILYSWLCQRLDQEVRNVVSNRTVSVLSLVGFVFIGFEIYLLRGALQQTLIRLLTFLLPVLVVFIVSYSFAAFRKVRGGGIARRDSK